MLSHVRVVGFLKETTYKDSVMLKVLICNAAKNSQELSKRTSDSCPAEKASCPIVPVIFQRSLDKVDRSAIGVYGSWW